MFGQSTNSLEDDIQRLMDDAPVVRSAIIALDKKIYDGINSYKLQRGSHIDIRELEKMDAVLRRRVLKNFVGRYYEHNVTQSQYKVVTDRNDDDLVLDSIDTHTKHFRVIRPK